MSADRLYQRGENQQSPRIANEMQPRRKSTGLAQFQEPHSTGERTASGKPKTSLPTRIRGFE
jgi:hypothetical protein